MFSYCMMQLAQPGNPWRTQALWMLIALLAVQQILLTAYSEAMLVDNMIDRSHPKEDEDLYTCVFNRKDSYMLLWPFRTKLLDGQPGPTLCASIAAYVVIGWLMASQDGEVLQTVYACGKYSVSAKWIAKW